jgi:hypothetical protein
MGDRWVLRMPAVEALSVARHRRPGPRRLSVESCGPCATAIESVRWITKIRSTSVCPLLLSTRRCVRDRFNSPSIDPAGQVLVTRREMS